MAPHDDDLLLGRRFLDRGRYGAGADHLLRGGRRLMAVHDQTDQPRLVLTYSLCDVAGVELVRLGIEDRDAMTAIAHIAGDQAAPERRLDRRQLVAEILIDAPAFAGIDQQ